MRRDDISGPHPCSFTSRVLILIKHKLTLTLKKKAPPLSLVSNEVQWTVLFSVSCPRRPYHGHRFLLGQLPISQQSQSGT